MDILSINDLSDFSQDEPIRNTSLSGIYLEYKRRDEPISDLPDKEEFPCCDPDKITGERTGKQFYDRQSV